MPARSHWTSTAGSGDFRIRVVLPLQRIVLASGGRYCLCSILGRAGVMAQLLIDTAHVRPGNSAGLHQAVTPPECLPSGLRRTSVPFSTDRSSLWMLPTLALVKHEHRRQTPSAWRRESRRPWLVHQQQGCVVDALSAVQAEAGQLFPALACRAGIAEAGASCCDLSPRLTAGTVAHCIMAWAGTDFVREGNSWPSAARSCSQFIIVFTGCAALPGSTPAVHQFLIGRVHQKPSA